MKLRYLLLILVFNFCSQPQKESVQAIQEVVDNPTGTHASLPYLIKGEDDNLYLSWVEEGDSNQVSFKFSKLAGDTWTEPSLIASGDDWFTNWADYPMMAVDQAGNKIAHYLAKSASGTYAYDVNIVLQSKDTSAWSSPVIPHKDGTPTEHGFVTMLPNNNDSFTLAWLDGRNTGGGDHSEHGHGGAMTLRTAVIDMNGGLSQESELDNRICDCCQTSGVITEKGPVFVYRDRSVDEIRDMAFVVKTDSTWTIPKLVANDNWNIAGCPVNGPRMDAHEGTMAVAWYTAALGRPTVKVAFKYAEEFDEPIIVDDTSPVGRVDIVMLDSQHAVVSWLDGGENPL